MIVILCSLIRIIFRLVIYSIIVYAILFEDVNPHFILYYR